jgi:hypothetical protein
MAGAALAPLVSRAPAPAEDGHMVHRKINIAPHKFELLANMSDMG